MDTKHTSGPWFLEGNWDATSTKKLGGWVSSFPPSGVPVFEMTPLVGSRENICANASLIAAAPDLLSALEDMRAVLPGAMAALMTLGRDGLLMADVLHKKDDVARAAIAKALGK